MTEAPSNADNVIDLGAERTRRKNSEEGAQSFFMSVLTSIASSINVGWVITFFNQNKQPGVSGRVESVSPDKKTVNVRTDSGKLETVRVSDFKPGGDIRVTTGQRKQN